MTESFQELEAPIVAVRRIAIVDDHPAFRRGIAELIDLEADLTVCFEAENASEGISAMRSLKPDGAIIDISMPGINGIELIKMIRAENPRLPILVLSMHKESLYAARALRAGARGYVMKSEAVTHIIDGLRRVLENRIYLSPQFSEQILFRAISQENFRFESPVDILTTRERQVLELMGNGRSTREIADELQMSTKTVEAHRGHMRQKLFLKDGGELVRFAQTWVNQEPAENPQRETSPLPIVE